MLDSATDTGEDGEAPDDDGVRRAAMGVDFKIKKLGLGNEQLTYLPTAGARLADCRWQA